MERSLIREPLTDVDLRELRRIRRLQELGVNMQGIEIILRMRRRIRWLQTELARRERARDGSTAIEVQEIWQRLLPWDPDSE
jgi:DNA-binding transcriptional MerR regulator